MLPRLEALENAMRDFEVREADNYNDLSKRLSVAEDTLNKNHEPRIKALEIDLASLKSSLSGMDSKDTSSLDTNQILMRLNFINDELAKKADKSDLQSGLHRLSQSLSDGLDKCNKEWQRAIDKLQKQIDALRSDLDFLRGGKDFTALVERVSTLEKKLG